MRYTDKAFASPDGLAALERIRARNGTDLDGTPLLKCVSDIASLERGGFVAVATRPEDGSAGPPWRVWPIWTDPRRERLPSDAYLEVLFRPDGSAVDQEVEQNFVCLQKSGAYLQQPMPRLPAFVQPLPIPAEIAPSKSVELRLKQFSHRFHPDLPPSVLWGYGGTFPGPTLRVRRDAPVVVRCANDLPAAGNSGFGHPWTSCRLESGSVTSVGSPEEFCKPGEVREHSLTMSASAPSTGWYRDARLGFSAQNVYKGLAGFLLATDPFDSGDENDPDPRASRLPSGPCDVPLMFAEKEFDTTLNHALAWDLFERDGFFGSILTVNGVVQPFLRVARRKYRFRLLNAGPSRSQGVRWSNERPFVLLGTDGGFFGTPRSTHYFSMGVGQRWDVVVDFSAVPLGTEMFLSVGLQPALKVIVDRDAPDPSRIPPRLNDVPADLVPAGAPTRKFAIDNPRGAWTVNGQAFDLAKPHARVKRGETEIWAVKNHSTDRLHSVGFRTLPFQIVSFNGNPVPEGFVRASYDLLPGDELRYLVKVGDKAGRYILPCSNQVHEDHGLVIRWDVEP